MDTTSEHKGGWAVMIDLPESFEGIQEMTGQRSEEVH